MLGVEMLETEMQLTEPHDTAPLACSARRWPSRGYFSPAITSAMFKAWSRIRV